MSSTAVAAMERILRLMRERKASDLYLSAHAPILVRINGNCLPVSSQPLELEAPRRLLAEIVPAARMTELDASGELNIGLELPGVGRYRISAMRQRGSVAAVVRCIAVDIPPLASLSLPAVLADLVMQKRGLLLLAGAAGSGTSTTLASMLDYRNENAVGHILSIEDPIEYLFKNKRSVVNQREVGADTASLQVALKNALRQSPDVLVVGEIRDHETLSAALAYAQSGQLCLATLHAANSYQALGRMLGLYPPEARAGALSDMAAALNAIVSQRLLRTRDGGRTPAVEVLVNRQTIAELIKAGDFSGVREALGQSMTEGSQSFEADIARLIAESRVDRKEGLAHADSSANLMWRLENDFGRAAATAPDATADDEPSFTDFTLDVRH